METMVKISLLLIVSSAVLILSWDSLKRPGSHGYYRFFTFEAILILILLNLAYWFLAPFSLRQIVSWVFLAVSLGLAVHGFYLLRKVGKPEGGFEDTTRLVTCGAYKYIRHPLYSSLLLFSLGAFLKHPDLTGLALLIAIAAFLTATARAEEAENLHHFGAEYSKYQENTKMFIPLIW